MLYHHKAATTIITISATMTTPVAAPATAPGDTELLLEPVPEEYKQYYGIRVVLSFTYVKVRICRSKRTEIHVVFLKIQGIRRL